MFREEEEEREEAIKFSKFKFLCEDRQVDSGVLCVCCCCCCCCFTISALEIIQIHCFTLSKKTRKTFWNQNYKTMVPDYMNNSDLNTI